MTTGRKVKCLRIHQSTLMEGVGNLTNPINIQAGYKKRGDLEGICLANGGVLIRGLLNYAGREAYIPQGNIILADLEPVSEKPVDAKPIKK